MSLITKKELVSWKLNSILVLHLKELATQVGLNSSGNGNDLKHRLVSADPTKIDLFIKTKYKDQIEERRKIISDKDLIKELNEIQDFKWTSVQGDLDQKIQAEYVRKYFRYADLINAIDKRLQSDIVSYVTATWFNHWTTILIENHIGENKNIVPTLKNNFGVDIFFRDQPFDLKITYLPRGYDINEAIKNPQKLAIWMYENQGAQRFGADNRFFVILANKKDLTKSWKLKRDFVFIYKNIDAFLEKSEVTEEDEIQFSFGGKSYTTVQKTLLIVK